MATIATVILGAGMGTRMKSSKPKVMHEIAGRPMVSHLLGTVRDMQAEKNIVVVAPGMQDVRDEVAPAEIAIQEEARGTGHAVAAALPNLEGFEGDVLVLYGDTPLITRETLDKMIAKRRENGKNAVVVLGFEPDDPAEYGRLVTAADGSLDAIVEFAEASDDIKAIGLCNSGVMAIDGEHIADLINAVDNKNAKGEYYLTDIVEIARTKGLLAQVVTGSEEELLGINNRMQLADAEKIAQTRWREDAMREGATLIDPDSVFFSHDTKLGRDVVVEPNVFFGLGVTVGDNVRIKANSHLEGTTIGENTQVGPFARLRPGADLGADVKVGNFVEVKKASLEDGAKVSHLSYIGDARVGKNANIGAGTITCNYDGYDKFKTDIGEGAFVGSNTSLVAPVTIGDGAIVGAGSTVTRNVDSDALMVERADEVQKQGWAARFRKLKARIKK
ncbi:bifunctional UDP-N-acetylglucosamine diphosphorylase/glucosamine-1-phosphate N-acetyltransferase GlmU [Sneathiella sp. P13V-1]|uniref:bifunctional UDP-N-acetylglucosamine diphosphorylase/glucosamine-1-phosphate N-acetyltransferase GlmU n=1 Tax=Sneathiella sp. P13V-1 TaxID=2697366 RepID=UPI00187B3665|nr:bifunctional UDP-N-acetylglucosamine diphosphorylase/glucosamine-1-phosphate N-acetyltransferase GlmU [Sneathiella sp. P13V-1]MBE7637116.1 bifunctional UDP-N-acetylglucosamine diphosphorylase/glucosamine-1-phosphate N-acetyltransferase GlmU [Sneathiella sp. P13V-1]